MKILVTNDDGVYAPGLTALYEALTGLGNIAVIAPDRDRSGVSNSLSLSRPMRARQLSNGFFSIEGTPADCVYLGLRGLLNEKPKMVISGINSGGNLGVDDVLYSGTVAAAMEGRFLGFPAIAISLAGEHTQYETAGKVIQVLVKHLMRHPLPNDTILNVNVPNVPFSELKGYKVTRLGRRLPAGNMVEAKDPIGETIYWVGPLGQEHDAGPETDFHAIKNNYVSMTPLEVDLTSYKIMDDLEYWSQTLTDMDKK